jgi:hypothetical protein
MKIVCRFFDLMWFLSQKEQKIHAFRKVIEKLIALQEWVSLKGFIWLWSLMW